MFNVFKIIALAAGVSLAAFAADAATVATGGTGSDGGVTGTGAFILPSDTVDTDNGSYFQGATTPASNWVWVADPESDFISYDFTFTFDLTGYDTSTASLEALWGVDNFGTVELNGTEVTSMSGDVFDNFNLLHAFDEGNATFNAGINTLTFHAVNVGGPGAFLASITVSADVAPVPLPASLPLLGAAMAGLGYVASRRKRKV